MTLKIRNVEFMQPQVWSYQSGGGVPPEPHGAHGEREKSRNVGSPRENY